MHIRTATLQDLHQITSIEQKCFPAAEAADEHAFAQRIKAFSSSFYVLEKDGEIIGFINGSITNHTTIVDEMYENATLHDPNGKYQAVFGLDVLPEYQKQGFARALMQHLIAQSKQQNRKGVILTCKKRLIPFYEKFGFVCKGRSASVHGNAVWYDMQLDF